LAGDKNRNPYKHWAGGCKRKPTTIKGWRAIANPYYHWVGGGKNSEKKEERVKAAY